MQEKAMYDTGEVTLTLLSAEDAMKHLNEASSVHCFPILNGEVLFTVNPRGLDIIGGHIDPGENYLQAMLREGMEEASIVISNPKVIGAIEVDNTNNPAAIEKGYPIKGYQLFFAVKDFEQKPFEATHECVAREFINPQDVKSRHHNWLKIHQHLLDEAVKVSKPKPKM
jgi:8-oxo-dGTP pyrophosphatase MutT (NUDIX family)